MGARSRRLHGRGECGNLSARSRKGRSDSAPPVLTARDRPRTRARGAHRRAVESAGFALPCAQREFVLERHRLCERDVRPSGGCPGPRSRRRRIPVAERGQRPATYRLSSQTVRGRPVRWLREPGLPVRRRWGHGKGRADGGRVEYACQKLGGVRRTVRSRSSQARRRRPLPSVGENLGQPGARNDGKAGEHPRVIAIVVRQVELSRPPRQQMRPVLGRRADDQRVAVLLAFARQLAFLPSAIAYVRRALLGAGQVAREREHVAKGECSAGDDPDER